MRASHIGLGLMLLAGGVGASDRYETVAGWALLCANNDVTTVVMCVARRDAADDDYYITVEYYRDRDGSRTGPTPVLKHDYWDRRALPTYRVDDGPPVDYDWRNRAQGEQLLTRLLRGQRIRVQAGNGNCRACVRYEIALDELKPALARLKAKFDEMRAAHPPPRTHPNNRP